MLPASLDTIFLSIFKAEISLISYSKNFGVIILRSMISLSDFLTCILNRATEGINLKTRGYLKLSYTTVQRKNHAKICKFNGNNTQNLTQFKQCKIMRGRVKPKPGQMIRIPYISNKLFNVEITCKYRADATLEVDRFRV